MSFMLVLMATIAMGAPSAEEMDRRQLVQLIDAAQEANCRDVSFDYEGREVVPGKPEDQVRLSYTGSFSRRADGAILADIHVFDKSAEMATRGIMAVLNGTTRTSTQQADEKDASLSVGDRDQDPLEFTGQANYRQVWLADWVKILAASPYRYESEGIRKLDGQECVVVRFRLVHDDSTPKDKTVSFLFWIDLNRGGHVVRFEHRMRGENLAELLTVRLAQFDRGKGQVAWLPVSGKLENRLTSKDKKIVFLDKPLNYSTYSLIPVTLRFDRGLKDDDFSVEAKPGDAISDEVRKARYEFGRYMLRPQPSTRTLTDAEIKAEMDRMLKDPAVMAGELKATSPLRDGPGVLSYWPWAVAGLATLGAGFLLFKGRSLGRR